MDVVIVTWSGGGATMPAVGIGRRLSHRGYRVRIVGPRALAERATAAGCELRPIPLEIEFDPTIDPMFENQSDYAVELFFGPGMANALDAELGRRPADVVLVDFLLRSTACLAESLALPTALLMHMANHHNAMTVDDSNDEWSQRWQYGLVNAWRAELGLNRLPVGPDTASIAIARRADAVLVPMTREFDPWPDRPENVVHVGPIFEEDSRAGWDSPWDGDGRPLVVVSMTTMYMEREGVLSRGQRSSASAPPRRSRSCGGHTILRGSFACQTTRSSTGTRRAFAKSGTTR